MRQIRTNHALCDNDRDANPAKIDLPLLHCRKSSRVEDGTAFLIGGREKSRFKITFRQELCRLALPHHPYVHLAG
jgi:hypothetical protein